MPSDACRCLLTPSDASSPGAVVTRAQVLRDRADEIFERERRLELAADSIRAAATSGVADAFDEAMAAGGLRASWEWQLEPAPRASAVASAAAAAAASAAATPVQY